MYITKSPLRRSKPYLVEAWHIPDKTDKENITEGLEKMSGWPKSYFEFSWEDKTDKEEWGLFVTVNLKRIRRETDSITVFLQDNMYFVNLGSPKKTVNVGLFWRPATFVSSLDGDTKFTAMTAYNFNVCYRRYGWSDEARVPEDGREQYERVKNESN